MPLARREEILACARELVESEGPEALTMRRLADRLGIQAPSLYKHVREKRELEAILAALAVEELGNALAGAADIGALSRRYRAWAVRHAHLYRLATERRLPPAAAPEALESPVVSRFVTGLGDEDRARAAWALVHGLVELELAGRLPAGAELEAAWAAGIRAFGTPLEAAAPRRAVFTSFGVD